MITVLVRALDRSNLVCGYTHMSPRSINCAKVLSTSFPVYTLWESWIDTIIVLIPSGILGSCVYSRELQVLVLCIVPSTFF